MLIQEYVNYKIWESNQRLLAMQQKHGLDGLEVVAIRPRVTARIMRLVRLIIVNLIRRT
ncbi:hypothetical protein [Cohnella herbarum]|uniref:Uncharacterized protein n=1 Tax=Cohnella herbarum TaxID=2728023 RepID=A0A7Z2VJS3_9BACL|nr:hypothetical protein [Cohnella herbarum]QJD84342.1 hypothetical protein HH215_14945 [Cohnella herbarum]